MRTVQPKVKQKAQPSMNVQREKERAQVLGRGAIPDDVGIFENTFIMPFGKNRPSWFGDFKARWKLEKYRLKARAVDWMQNFYYRWWAVRPRPRLHLRTAATAGKQLHREMYQAFAAGDLTSMQDRICTGLLTSLRARIGQRPANTHLRWTLHKYLSTPRLVSIKAGLLPGADAKPVKDPGAQNAFLQAIIRIHSLQSLQHVRTSLVRDRQGNTSRKGVVVDAQGRELPADDEASALKNAKETVEYFVIQKQMRRSREGPWMVWGTAEETSLQKADIKAMRRKMKEKERKEGAGSGGGMEVGGA